MGVILGVQDWVLLESGCVVDLDYLDDMGYLCEIREFGWLASGCFVYVCVFSDSYI